MLENMLLNVFIRIKNKQLSLCIFIKKMASLSIRVIKC